MTGVPACDQKYCQMVRIIGAMPSSELGQFLRACRARLDPTDVGLPYIGVRRVAGLRREEVAALAGVSADYYTRLEQGRERNPSGQVVDAISRALRLDPDGREHLFRVAGVVPGTRTSGEDNVDPSLLGFIDSLPHPALLINRTLDVLAKNLWQMHCSRHTRRLIIWPE